MTLSMMINFDGDCREAVTFYAAVFDREVPHFLTYGEGDVSFDTNVAMSAAGSGKVMHCVLDIAGTPVVFCDMPDNFDFIRGNSHHLTVICADRRKAETLLERLAENGRIFVPLTEVPGQGWHSMVTDRFGLSWIIQAK